MNGFERLREELQGLWRELQGGGNGPGVVRLLRPAAPFDRWYAPALAVGSLIALIGLVGTGVLAIFVLLAVSLAIHLIVTEVLGITVEIHPVAA